MKSLSELHGFGKKRLETLKAHEIETGEDLLEFLPVGYYDSIHPLEPSEMTDGVEACFTGTVLTSPTSGWGKGGRQWISVSFGDSKKRLRCMWLNQVWMKEKLSKGQEFVFYGRANEKENGTYIFNPVIVEPGKIISIYRKLPEIGQKMLRTAIEELLAEEIQDYLPAQLRQKFDLVDRKTAFHSIHFPETTDALAGAKRRLAFDELLLFQTAMIREDGDAREKREVLSIDPAWLERYISQLPYTPTEAQLRACHDIETDLGKPVAMARMVQGDVGCGKTMVAFLSMYLAVCAGGQAVLMAPTEILAAQHYENAVRELEKLGVTCGLLTGKLSSAEHREALSAIREGRWKVIIGTHALISKGVKYQNLQLVVIDEQHRFGVRQRTGLGEKGQSPHVLVMSATPIPRSLSLVMYGDMDISIIAEMPKGRIPVTTRIVPDSKRSGMYDFIAKETEKGHQCYIVCPLIGDEDPNSEDRSAVNVYSEVQKAMPAVQSALVHGQMKQQEKEEVLSRFYRGEVKVLVSTTVIEVGVNVPGATIIVIEQADRFGLAQLHQLRGRVGRGTEGSWCFLMSNRANERLRFLCSSNDGFEIARKDMETRGVGEYFGTRQSGAPEMPALFLTADTRLLDETRTALNQLKQMPEFSGVLHFARQKYGIRNVARN